MIKYQGKYFSNKVCYVFQPLGASDYLVISKTFHTVFIRNLPQLSITNHRSQMRRFITLIDTLYDNRVRVSQQILNKYFNEITILKSNKYLNVIRL